MKKLLLIGLIITLVGSLSAQEIKRNPSNTVYASFAPTDFGVGIRVDRQFNNKGVYTALSYGNYDFVGGYINDHIKIALGGISYIGNAFFTFGGSYNYYGEHKIPEGMNVRTFKTLSYELGVGNTLGNMNLSIIMDVVKWESSISVGFKF